MAWKPTGLLLSVVVLVYGVLALAYASATPRWQNPDEPAHYNYAREIADHARLPVLVVGDYDQAELERLKASKFAGEPDVSRIRYESYQPPLYYLLGGVVIALLPGTAQDLYGLRVLSIACGVLILLVVCAIGHEIFPDDPVVGLGAAALLAFIPQHLAMTAAANNDTLGELLLGLAVLVGVTRIKGLNDCLFILAGGVVFGLALLTKVTAYTSGIVLIAAEFARWRTRRSAAYAHLAAIAALVAVGMLIGGWWFVRNAVTYGNGDILALARHDQVVVGQPRTIMGMAAARHFIAVTFRSFWAQFGWMGVLVDGRIYLLLGVLTVIALIGLAAFLIGPMRKRRDWQHWGLALLALQFLLIAGIMLVYNLTFLQPQGRYLFPASAAIAILLALGLQEMIGRPRTLAALIAAGTIAAFVVGGGKLVLVAGALAIAIVLGVSAMAKPVQCTILWMALCVALIALDIVCLVRFIVPALTVT